MSWQTGGKGNREIGRALARRAHEVADGKVTLIDADDVHAEIAERLRWTGPRSGNP